MVKNNAGKISEPEKSRAIILILGKDWAGPLFDFPFLVASPPLLVLSPARFAVPDFVGQKTNEGGVHKMGLTTFISTKH